MSSHVSLAREVAYDTFIDALFNKVNIEDALNERYQKYGSRLTRLDRNFIKELVFGSLRWYGKIYWILQNTSKRDLDKSSPQVRAALVMGTYQIYYMDKVPDRAAVNESAEYIRKKKQEKAVSFVNGILRQISRKSVYFPKPDKEKDSAKYLSVQFAFPEWIAHRWLRQFKFQRLEVMMATMNQPPPFCIRVNSLKYDLKNSVELQNVLLKDA